MGSLAKTALKGLGFRVQGFGFDNPCKARSLYLDGPSPQHALVRKGPLQGYVGILLTVVSAKKDS